MLPVRLGAPLRAGGRVKSIGAWVDALVEASVKSLPREAMEEVLRLAILERVEVMHQRAQAAEGRAQRAEARLDRLARMVGCFKEE